MDLLWDIRVVLDLFLGGIGIGAFILASILYVVGKDEYKDVYTIGFFIAPILVALGLIFLLLEIGRPFHAVIMLISVNPTSILSWGGFLQGAFILLSVYTLYKVYKNQELNKSFLFGVMFLAFLIGIYHGALLSSFGRSVWNSSLPVLFLATSLFTGFFTTLLLAKIVKDKRVHSKFITSSMIVFLMLSVVSIIGWIYGLASQDSSSKEALEYLFSHYLILIIVAVLLGTLVPLVLNIKTLFTKKELSSVEFNLASISALVGVFVLKYVVVYIGQLDYLVK